jgi:hypothetical protein
MNAPSNAAYPHRAILLRDNSARTQPGKFSDRALIAAIACGDQQAMRRLYDRHSANVYRFARRLRLDRSAAEDLVSEVFLEVWRHARAFEGRAQVSTLLLAITRYRGLDMIRRSPLEPLDEIEHIRDDADGPEGRWNIWTTGILVALLAGAAVAAFAIWITASVPIIEVLFTCVAGFLAGLGIATVRNWFVDP